MRYFGATILVGVLLIGFGVSCEKIATEPQVNTEIAAPLTDIPAEYGELEAVTTMPEYPGWFQLWFEDEAGTIRIVRIQMAQNLIHRQIKVIPRSGAVQEEVIQDEG